MVLSSDQVRKNTGILCFLCYINCWSIVHFIFSALYMLRFYSPINPMGSCWSVFLTTLLLGRLSPRQQLTSIVYILSTNWQLPLLKQQKGENDRRKYFMNCWLEVKPTTPISPVGRASSWATEASFSTLYIIRWSSVRKHCIVCFLCYINSWSSD